MKTGSKLLAIIVAAAFATATFAPPASASFWGGGCWWCHYPKPVKKAPPKAPSSGSAGKLIVGCIMGSALGLITASIVKGGGLKLMTQKEFEDNPRDKSKDLTTEEALFIASTCGLGAFAVRPAQATTVVVKAKY